MALQLQQGTLDGADGLHGDVAVLCGVLLGMLRYPVEHGTQVLQVYQEQTALVGNAKHDVQHTVLRLVQLHQSTEQLWTHLRDGGTHGMSLFTKHVEEPHRTRLELWILDTELRQSLLDESTHLARLRDAAQVALHISHETRYTSLTESLGHHL